MGEEGGRGGGERDGDFVDTVLVDESSLSVPTFVSISER